ncbi:protein of unknown function DUF1653 [Desulfotomaculum nigrificans CO-1-SRB]|uniref:GIY-YIG domain-containing protein n=1 Tax=Desulfotomaculum nigrificans (strain DSM 14880 / VKM B-2319 / CO-1-SRB) TaxID=868595 RepID=F6B6D1_DESCC|nr:protein of unknown function DUF1653 [Desulfotomaculum nigrificans CO-1-SRB]
MGNPEQFKFICEIKPLTDKDGRLIEYEPYKKYKNAAGLKLHKYGKGPFCQFRIPSNIPQAGVYILKVNNEIKYVGECENLSSRYNTGYGQISPRNCFLGGQSTNCKINSYIIKEIKKGSKVELLFRQSQDRFTLERELIEMYKPEWNSTTGKRINKSEIKQNKVSDKNKEVKTVSGTQKYEPIKDYLLNCKSGSIQLSYQEIEKILEKPLPNSAYKYREWWANGGHSQADAWLAAGWKVEEVHLGKYIVFRRDSFKATISEQQTIKLGKKYKHFKGKEYLVLYLAKHSETLEDLVVYQALYGEKGIWVRPLSMFLEKVEVNGEFVDRFKVAE